MQPQIIAGVEPRTGRPIWLDDASPQEFDRLDGNLETDICVVGAGIAGLSAARLLAKAGREVAVFDHGPVGGGETGRTTAHLSWALDDRFYYLEQRFGT